MYIEEVRENIEPVFEIREKKNYNLQGAGDNDDDDDNFRRLYPL